jgi:hypothetical protein
MFYIHIYIYITCALRACEVTRQVDRPLILNLKQKVLFILI